MAKIDNLVVFRCVQVVRRLLLKNREIGLFCNISASTLTDAAVFQQLLDFLDANRAIAPSVVLEFTQSALRADRPDRERKPGRAAPTRLPFLAWTTCRTCGWSRASSPTRGFRFIKVPATLLLEPHRRAPADIHPADLSDLLGRFGIDLIAERIESEAQVVDLLDYDVRFGQGFLFSPPRPVRAEALQEAARSDDRAQRRAAGSPIAGRADDAYWPRARQRSPTCRAARPGSTAAAKAVALASVIG